MNWKYFGTDECVGIGQTSVSVAIAKYVFHVSILPLFFIFFLYWETDVGLTLKNDDLMFGL